jgi:hypothetical protein
MAPAGLLALALTLTLEGGAPPASVPAARIAVVMLPASPSDQAVANNLTEVVIARLAALGALEIIGTEELLRRVGIGDAHAAQACLDQPTCIDRVAVSLGVAWILTGSVDARRRDQFVFNLALRDVQRGQIDRRVFDTVDGPLEALVRRVQTATQDLFRPPPPEGRIRIEPLGMRAEVSIDRRYVGVAPLTASGLPPGRHVVRLEVADHFPWSSQLDVAPGQTVVLRLNPSDLRRHLRWPRNAVLATGGAAVVLAAGGAVLGSIALFSPLTGDRAEAQRQFEDRRTLGAIADGMLAGGALLAATAVALLAAYHEHVFFRP